MAAGIPPAKLYLSVIISLLCCLETASANLSFQIHGQLPFLDKPRFGVESRHPLTSAGEIILLVFGYRYPLPSFPVGSILWKLGVGCAEPTWLQLLDLQLQSLPLTVCSSKSHLHSHPSVALNEPLHFTLTASFSHDASRHTQRPPWPTESSSYRETGSRDSFFNNRSHSARTASCCEQPR